MTLDRRRFLQRGLVGAVAGIALPSWLSSVARAQSSSGRNLVLLDLSGGNDGLSTLIPYTDPFYYSRRPTLAVPAGTVLPVGRDSTGHALGLHPRLIGLLNLFNQGNVALIQRVGYANSSRSHFQGTDIWSTANPLNSQGAGWIGRYLGSLPAPLDPLIAWNTQSDPPQVLEASNVSVASIPSISGYAFSSPNSGSEAVLEGSAAIQLVTTSPSTPLEAYISTVSQAAMATLSRVAMVGTYKPTVAYPAGSFGTALQAVAGAMATGLPTKVFYVQTGGFDNHASEDTTSPNGTYYRLMANLNDGLVAFCTDLRNMGLFSRTLVLSFSEFGRRITENGSRGTDHGAASVMLALGGLVRGGLYGTAASLNPDPQNPTLENSGGDVHYETDFRSVYATVIDRWLNGNSVATLGGDFRSALSFI